MNPPPFDVRLELDGWDLFWAKLTAIPGFEEDLASLRVAVTDCVRAELKLKTLASHPPVAVMRQLFKAAGCQPSRYRPSSEALLRRVLKGQDLPQIHPLVDFANCLSVTLRVPCSVSVAGALKPPVVLRAGIDGESYDSLRGPFKLTGRPLLADANGPVDTPITGSQRVKVRADTEEAWLVAYLPSRVVLPEEVGRTLRDLSAAAPAVDVDSPSATLFSRTI